MSACSIACDHKSAYECEQASKKIESHKDNSTEKDIKLLIFGWITTVLGLPEAGDPTKYNELTDKLYELFHGLHSTDKPKCPKCGKATYDETGGLCNDCAPTQPANSELREQFKKYFPATGKPYEDQVVVKLSDLEKFIESREADIRKRLEQQLDAANDNLMYQTNVTKNENLIREWKGTVFGIELCITALSDHSKGDV